jgi:hypothetical protein
MVKKALLIGINYIGSSCQLNGCINDVINIKNFLLTEQGFSENDIKVLTETDENTSNHPTRGNILSCIDDLVRDNTSDSQLFLHYSGHGGYITDTNGDEADGKDETLCPLDYDTAGEIVDDELRVRLVNPLVKGAKLTALFDCCHSGTALDLRYNYKLYNDAKKKYEFSIISDEHYPISKGTVVLISGAKDDQTGADAWEAGKYQGAMTYSFLESYKALNSKNKRVSYKRFMKYLLKFIKGKGYTQTPQISSGKFLNIDETMVF